MFKSVKFRRIATGGTAAALTGAAIYGWMTTSTLQGNISADGNWDVALSSAAIISQSDAVTVNGEQTEAPAAGQAKLYEARLVLDSDQTSYLLQIDDLNPVDTKLNLDELDAYKYHLSIPNYSNTLRYTSGLVTKSHTGFAVKVDNSDIVSFSGSTNTILDNSIENKDGGKSDGAHVGYAIGWTVDGQSSNVSDNPNIVLTYASAKEEASQPGNSCYQAVVDGNTATYPDVTFKMPGAWVEYKAEIVNKGLVNANLSEYALESSAIDSFAEVNFPEFSEGETLAPGETCTVTFTAKAKADGDFGNSTGSFTVTLTHVQDEIEEAPAPSHTH